MWLNPEGGTGDQVAFAKFWGTTMTSPFYQYAGHDPLRNGLSGLGVLVALATVAALVVLAVAGFRRRDVAA